MANRFPLIVDSSSQRIKELPNGDNLDLTGNGISAVRDILPEVSSSYDLGSSTKHWKDLYLSSILATNQSSFNLLNNTATTINFGGDATTVNIGASTGTTSIKNDLEVQGGDITTNQTSFNLINGTATTVQAFGAAETLVFASATGTTTFRSNVVINNDLQIKGGDLTTNASTFNLLNDTPTTVNAFNAAQTINIGSAAGTTNVKNKLVVDLDLEVSGNLIINGTTTTISTTDLLIEDKNITLANGATTDAQADGGGLTLKGTTDKTFSWIDSTDSWTSSEHLDLATGKEFKINNTTVLSSTQVLGKSLPTGDVVGSSDTQTLTNKTLGATTIAGSLIPNTDITYDLGSATNRFRDLYLSGNSMFLGDAKIMIKDNKLVMNTNKAGNYAVETDLEMVNKVTASLTTLPIVIALGGM